MMSWKKIVVGVDTSPEAIAAASLAWELATAGDGSCRFVHVTDDVSAVPATLPPTVNLPDLTDTIQAAARKAVEDALRPALPVEAIEALDVRMGRAQWVLPRMVGELDADLLVLGGKHHTAPVRWFGGSTAHHAVRTVDVPLLVAMLGRPVIDRVLAAVDLSHAVGPVLEVAKQVASLTNAKLGVAHAVEPLPQYAEYPLVVDHAEFAQWSESQFHQLMDSALPDASVDRLVGQGAAVEVLGKHVEEWKADLLVVGSHGKGWVERLVVGSTTLRLLNRLPTSLLVAPVGEPSEPS